MSSLTVTPIYPVTYLYLYFRHTCILSFRHFPCRSLTRQQGHLPQLMILNKCWITFIYYKEDDLVCQSNFCPWGRFSCPVFQEDAKCVYNIAKVFFGLNSHIKDTHKSSKFRFFHLAMQGLIATETN